MYSIYILLNLSRYFNVIFIYINQARPATSIIGFDFVRCMQPAYCTMSLLTTRRIVLIYEFFHSFVFVKLIYKNLVHTHRDDY